MTTSRISFRSVLRSCGLVGAFFVLQLCARSQTTLTGAVQFTSTDTGSFIHSGYWNTLGGDYTFDLWFSLNPNGSAPVNGPGDAQAGISIPLEAGKTYKYYTFGYPGSNFGFTGINLFFDGNNSTPGISAFGPIGEKAFFPNSSTTATLQITDVPGSGTTYYSSGGVVVLLTGFNWNLPAGVPGNVVQDYEFAPGDKEVYWGSFSLEVFTAASLSLDPASGSPLNKVTVNGSGFSPDEGVGIYEGGLGSPLLGAATTNGDGSFSATITAPQHPYGSTTFFALGHSSHDVGIASFSVSPSLTMSPNSVEPGGTTAAEGLGFGAGEAVSVYLIEPRVLLGTATANSLGSFLGSSALTVTIPSDASTGINGLIGIGQTTGAIGIGRITVK